MIIGAGLWNLAFARALLRIEWTPLPHTENSLCNTAIKLVSVPHIANMLFKSAASVFTLSVLSFDRDVLFRQNLIHALSLWKLCCMFLVPCSTGLASATSHTFHCPGPVWALCSPPDLLPSPSTTVPIALLYEVLGPREPVSVHFPEVLLGVFTLCSPR